MSSASVRIRLKIVSERGCSTTRYLRGIYWKFSVEHWMWTIGFDGIEGRRCLENKFKRVGDVRYLMTIEYWIVRHSSEYLYPEFNRPPGFLPSTRYLSVNVLKSICELFPQKTRTRGDTREWEWVKIFLSAVHITEVIHRPAMNHDPVHQTKNYVGMAVVHERIICLTLRVSLRKIFVVKITTIRSSTRSALKNCNFYPYL